jgi:hypothetical protein
MEGSQVVVAANMWRISQVVVPLNGGITSCGSCEDVENIASCGPCQWRDHKLWCSKMWRISQVVVAEYRVAA